MRRSEIGLCVLAGIAISLQIIEATPVLLAPVALLYFGAVGAVVVRSNASERPVAEILIRYVVAITSFLILLALALGLVGLLRRPILGPAVDAAVLGYAIFVGRMEEPGPSSRERASRWRAAIPWTIACLAVLTVSYVAAIHAESVTFRRPMALSAVQRPDSSFDISIVGATAGTYQVVLVEPGTTRTVAGPLELSSHATFDTSVNVTDPSRSSVELVSLPGKKVVRELRLETTNEPAKTAD